MKGIRFAVVLLLGLAVAVKSASDQIWKGRKLKLVMEDTFDKSNVDLAKWEREISLWGGGNSEFQAYTNLDENSYIRNGTLYMKPTMTADRYGSSFLYSGTWDVKKVFGKCTMSAISGCYRTGGHDILNPILSSKLRSLKGIKYGKVEIVAKLPRGDWIWPALWMLPNFGPRHGGGAYGNWPQSGEIDIMEARGNRQYGNIGIEHMGSTLHWGTNNNGHIINKFQMTTKEKKAKWRSLADGTHKFTLLWDQDAIETYLDDDLVARFSTPSQSFFRWGNLPGSNPWGSAKNAPFDKEFYLIMNVAVGGTGYFPDNVYNAGYQKPWRNSDSNAQKKFWEARNLWQPTWKGEDAAMAVESVRMWQLQ